MLGALTANLAALGDRLGIYKAIKDGVAVNGQNGQNGQSGLTSGQLADKMDLNERFLREWLYQQVILNPYTLHPISYTFKPQTPVWNCD